ncbi:MAG: DUF305 domain-containing protein [Gemmatimonadales bacterium]|jgi:uncharacterized protein (DUF305 family)
MEFPVRPSSIRDRVRLAALVLIGTILLSFAAGCGSAGQGSTAAETPASGPVPTVDSAAYVPESDAPYVAADADFVRGMLVHHAQALAMAALVDERTDDPSILSLARRITRSQEYEIGLMNNWLAAHDEPGPAHGLGPHGGAPPEHAHMAGLASVAQMEALEGSRGPAFDRMFLRLMIPHHEGALTMVDDLRTHEGAGQEPALFQLISDIDADQRAEIARMKALLTRLEG